MTGGERPREGSSISSPKAVEPSDNAKLYDQNDQLRSFQARAVSPQPEEVGTRNVDEGGSPNGRPETIQEPKFIELSTVPPSSAPDPGEVGVEERAKTPKPPPGISGIVEVCLY